MANRILLLMPLQPLTLRVADVPAETAATAGVSVVAIVATVAVAADLVVTPGTPSKRNPSISRKTGTDCAGFSFFW